MSLIHTTTGRRFLQFTAGLVAASGLAWAAASHGGDKSVDVKVDKTPVAAANTPLGPSYAPIVKRVAPSVVKVLVTERAHEMQQRNLPQFFDDPQLRRFFGIPDDGSGDGSSRRGAAPEAPVEQGLGSGVIVSPDGYILTNNHVVNGADTIKVSLNDGRELNAKVVGTDPDTDLAVVKVDAKNLPAITFADSDKAEVGDHVLAVGNPFGIGETVTSGMVSGLGRATMGLEYEDFIQTDAAINPGNSGGALVDAEGRLLGVNTAILSRTGGFQGIGFAIPSNLAHSVMEQLVSNGRVVRGYLGVDVQDVTPELADQFKVGNNKGALVAAVVDGSPAAEAGIRSGDVIKSFDGAPVVDSRRLKLAVAEVAPGTKVKTEVMRDGKDVDLTIAIAARPSDKEMAQNGGRMGRYRGNRGGREQGSAANDTGTLNGVGVADLDAQARQEFDVPAEVHGALITEVDPNSAAAAAGLQPGDVIEEINHQAVHSGDDAVKLTENPPSRKTLLRLWNQTGNHYVVVDETGSSSNAHNQG